MKQPSFMEGVLVALTAALTAGAANAVLPMFMPHKTVWYLLIAALGLGYVLYLLSRSRERVGRVTTLAVWLSASVLGWLWWPSIGLYLALHLGLVWLVRSLYHQSGVLSALTDLALNLLALMGGVWAWLQTGSPFLAVWSFFLVQALFVVIPGWIGKSAGRQSASEADPFQQAYHSAETALRALSNVK